MDYSIICPLCGTNIGNREFQNLTQVYCQIENKNEPEIIEGGFSKIILYRDKVEVVIALDGTFRKFSVTGFSNPKLAKKYYNYIIFLIESSKDRNINNPYRGEFVNLNAPFLACISNQKLKFDLC